MYEILSQLDIGEELIVFLCAMVPVIELRGAIPLGISLGMDPIKSGVISIIGNAFIMLFLINLFDPLTRLLERTKIFKSTIGWAKKRAMKKSGIIKKYSVIGLFFFVGLPIPTTGVWTGSIIVNIMKLDKKKSFISMFLGLIGASSIILLIYYGIIN